MTFLSCFRALFPLRCQGWGKSSSQDAEIFIPPLSKTKGTNISPILSPFSNNSPSEVEIDEPLPPPNSS